MRIRNTAVPELTNTATSIVTEVIMKIILGNLMSFPVKQNNESKQMFWLID
jgi:hypothetical protein